MKKQILKAVICTIITTTVISLLLFWLFQMRPDINNVNSWWVLFFSALPSIGIMLLSDAGEDRMNGTITALVFPVTAIVVIAVGSLIASPLFQSKNFYHKVADKVTVVEESEGSPFVNLIDKGGDTSNLPLLGTPEVIKKAETEMGKRASLGSQFEILSKFVTSQNINGELKAVVPLEPRSMFKWHGNNKGYFIVDRNNGEVEFVEKGLKTTEQAPFFNSAKRIINHYLVVNNIFGQVTDISPEVTDGGEFRYVATVYKKNFMGSFPTVKGVVELDPYSKHCKYYSVNEVPEYVDRVYPEWIFKKYLHYYGEYSHGYWNSVFSAKGVIEATKGVDVIYIDGTCYYYSGITSSGKDESSNGIMMMNSKTGEISYYKTYGISEPMAQKVSEGIVQEKKYDASFPLLMKIGEEESYFSLMRDKNKNIAGYSFVSYKDYTKSAFGKTLDEAKRNYLAILNKNNTSEELDNNKLVSASAVIEKISSEVVKGDTVYYLKLQGIDKVFTLKSDLNVDIVFAKVGDTVNIEYAESENKVIALREVKF